MSQFRAKTGEFEGPLDLLLSLIERRKMHIGDVSLAAVADDFIAHLETLGGDRSAEIAEFLLIAATLMLYKSRALLPEYRTRAPEETPPEELERRLGAYALVREIGKRLASMGRGEIFLRPLGKPARAYPTTAARLAGIPAGTAVYRDTLARLLTRISDARARIPATHVHAKERLEEVLLELEEHLRRRSHAFFREVAPAGDRARTTTRFLALLELVRRGSASAHQSAHHADIRISGRTISTPLYA